MTLISWLWRSTHAAKSSLPRCISGGHRRRCCVVVFCHSLLHRGARHHLHFDPCLLVSSIKTPQQSQRDLRWLYLGVDKRPSGHHRHPQDFNLFPRKPFVVCHNSLHNVEPCIKNFLQEYLWFLEYMLFPLRVHRPLTFGLVVSAQRPDSVDYANIFGVARTELLLKGGGKSSTEGEPSFFRGNTCAIVNHIFQLGWHTIFRQRHRFPQHTLCNAEYAAVHRAVGAIFLVKIRNHLAIMILDLRDLSTCGGFESYRLLCFFQQQGSHCPVQRAAPKQTAHGKPTARGATAMGSPSMGLVEQI
mmetsp:Transcript_27641/g.66885  ORF Transcript_27641/g.66885 Transcript_27641/m.66885 type:complete len:302 (-) Transcript_27641:7-912(-)